MQGTRFFLLMALGAVLLGGCAGTHDSAMMAKKKSLYERLGGKVAIIALVDDLLTRVAADSQINHFFAAADMAQLKVNLVDQLCEATGGPCKYRGKDMKTAHKGLGVSNIHFDAMGNDMVAALDHAKVPEKEKNEVLVLLGSMRKDIVER